MKGVPETKLNELSAFDTGQNSIVVANSEECQKNHSDGIFFMLVS